MWRGIFACSALYNFAVGGALLADADRAAAGLGLSGSGAPFAIAMVGMLIAVFGVGYAMVSHAPARNRGVVWIGLALGTTQ